MPNKNQKEERTFTLSQMLECWEVAQDSWAQECGADMEDYGEFAEDDGYVVPINKQAWFKERFQIDIEN